MNPKYYFMVYNNDPKSIYAGYAVYIKNIINEKDVDTGLLDTVNDLLEHTCFDAELKDGMYLGEIKLCTGTEDTNNGIEFYSYGEFEKLIRVQSIDPND